MFRGTSPLINIYFLRIVYLIYLLRASQMQWCKCMVIPDINRKSCLISDIIKIWLAPMGSSLPVSACLQTRSLIPQSYHQKFSVQMSTMPTIGIPYLSRVEVCIQDDKLTPNIWRQGWELKCCWRVYSYSVGHSGNRNLGLTLNREK